MKSVSAALTIVGSGAAQMQWRLFRLAVARMDPRCLSQYSTSLRALLSSMLDPRSNCSSCALTRSQPLGFEETERARGCRLLRHLSLVGKYEG